MHPNSLVETLRDRPRGGKIPISQLLGDFEGNDFLIWQNSFPYLAALSTVPEPNSLAQLMMPGRRVAVYRSSQKTFLAGMWVASGLLQSGDSNRTKPES